MPCRVRFVYFVMSSKKKKEKGGKAVHNNNNNIISETIKSLLTDFMHAVVVIT